MRQDLKDAMPDAVRDQLPESGPRRELEPDATDPNEHLGLEISDEMAPAAPKFKIPSFSGPA
jgi:hypothetical protein